MVKMALVLWYENRIDQDTLLQFLFKFECEMATAFHWVSDVYWDECIEAFLVQIDNKGINSLTQHHQTLILLKKDLLINHTLNANNAANLLRQINSKNVPPAPDKIYISNIRQRVINENDLIACKISISENWKNCNLFPSLFELGTSAVYKYYETKTLLLAPLKAALAFTEEENEIEKSIWFSPKEMRRAILFYRQYTPKIYLELFECMVKRINFLKKSRN